MIVRGVCCWVCLRSSSLSTHNPTGWSSAAAKMVRFGRGFVFLTLVGTNKGIARLRIQTLKLACNFGIAKVRKLLWKTTVECMLSVGGALNNSKVILARWFLLRPDAM